MIGALLAPFLVALVAYGQSFSRAEPQAPTPPPATAKPALPAYVPGTLLVKPKQGVAIQTIEALSGGRGKGRPTKTVERLGVPVGQEHEHLQRLRSSGLVEYVELEHVRRPGIEPNDPRYGEQWALPKIGAPAAWSVVTGSITVTVAVVDTGVDASHPDLAGQVLPGRNFTTDWASDPNNATDNHGHGTHVAGIAAAIGNNAVGIAGIAWNVRILPVKVLNSAGDGSDGDVAAGIVWAADQGAKVINLSLGGPGYGQTLADAVAYARNRGVLVVAAMGNSGERQSGDSANPIFYPAAYPGVLAVAATNQSEDRAPFSQYHDHTSVSAPGVSILSTVPASGAMGNGSRYGSYGGTSMATPHVSGLAALVFSLHPAYTPEQVKATIEQSAFDLGQPDWDQEFGWGRIDAARAVTLTQTTTAIRGRVLDHSGQPVADALVEANGFQTTSGWDGRYALPVSTGTHTVTASAPGSGSGPGRRNLPVTTGSWTAADFVLPPVSSVISNSGFEAGSLNGWTASSTASVEGDPAARTLAGAARTGEFGASLGYAEDTSSSGVNFTSDARLSQQIMIPTGARLSFWYRLETTDLNASSPCGYDCFRVTLKSPAGSTLVSVLETDQGSGWRPIFADLSMFAGQTVVLEFWLHNDINQTTSVRLDDVSLGPVGTPITPTPTPTSMPSPTPLPSPMPTPMQPSPTIRNSALRVSNVSENSFTVSWTTSVSTTASIVYGPVTGTMASQASDIRANVTSDRHLVFVSGLFPNTAYQFDLVHGNTVDDNGGAHFQARTGPVLEALPTPDNLYGYVRRADGTSPATGAIVSVKVRNADGQGSTGDSGWLSTLTASDGSWVISLPPRERSLGVIFAYSLMSDTLIVDVDGGGEGTIATTHDTGVNRLLAPVSLQPTRVVSVPVMAGWNLLSLPVSPTVGLRASDWAAQLTSQGITVTQIARWERGSWESHIVGFQANNFLVEPGRGYFVRASGYGTWRAEGAPYRTGVAVSIAVGWNLLAVPFAQYEYTAESLAQEVSAQRVEASQVVRWRDGSWLTHRLGFPPNDFAIEPGAGYFVRAGGYTSWTPDQ